MVKLPGFLLAEVFNPKRKIRGINLPEQFQALAGDEHIHRPPVLRTLPAGHQSFIYQLVDNAGGIGGLVQHALNEQIHRSRQGMLAPQDT